MIPLLLLVLLGLVIGFLVGLTGAGGAALLTPIFIFLNFSALTAVGSDLIFNAIIKFVGSSLHFKKGNVDKHILLPLLAGAVPALLFGWFLLSWAKQRFNILLVDFYIEIGLGVVLLITGIMVSASLITDKKKKAVAGVKAPSRKIGAFLGGIVALCVQMTSVGGGVAIMPYLLRVTKDIKKAVGTDLAYGLFVSLIAGLLHFSLGNVNFPLILPLLVGAIPATAAGVLVASRTGRHDLLRLAITIIVLLSGIAMLYTALSSVH